LASRVYDASAFYAGIPFASPEQGLTTTLVFDEIKHIKKSHGAIEILLDTDRLRIEDPDYTSTEFVSDMAKKTGDFQKLSNADISAVALAYQLSASLVTDDFAISNLAKNLKIQVQPVMTKGIKDVGRWIHYCAGCKKGFSGTEFCPNCGNKLNRKLLKR
jgi:endoribonuclease Nob1